MLHPQLPHHTITLVRRKGAYKSAACRAFAELAADWCVGGCQVTLKCPLLDDSCNRHARDDDEETLLERF